MMISKNHKSGFAFIEIMIAIALLAVFGTNLFMTQAQIFANIARTHRKVINVILSTTIAPDFFTKLLDAQKQKKPVDSIVLDKEIKYPSAHIHLAIKKIPEKSALVDFAEYLQLVEETITNDDKQNRTISFLFAPLPTKEKDANKETTTAKGTT